MTDCSYAIIGTGAVGGLYGARLQRAGFDVHFLLRSDYEHVRQHGLWIESVEGDFRLDRVHAYDDPRKMPRGDRVIVAVKATANDQLPGILPHVVRPGSLVILLQNGLGAEARLAPLVPQCTLLGGLSFLCAYKAGPGHVRHLDYGKIALALYREDGRPGGVTEEMRRIAADFERSGTPVQLADDLVLARWNKLVWNVPFNGLSVVLDADTRQIMQEAGARALARELMKEVVEGAATQGRVIPEAFVEQMLADTDRMRPYRTSMKLDYDLCRPMEVEAIYGVPWRTAAASGRELPRIGMLYRQLKFLDARRALKRGA